jgi:hypothetical protein
MKKRILSVLMLAMGLILASLPCLVHANEDCNMGVYPMMLPPPFVSSRMPFSAVRFLQSRGYTAFTDAKRRDESPLILSISVDSHTPGTFFVDFSVADVRNNLKEVFSYRTPTILGAWPTEFAIIATLWALPPCEALLESLNRCESDLFITTR